MVKRRRKSAPEIKGAIEIIQDERKKASTNLETAADETDLEYLMKTVQALISTNTDIWGRCNHHEALDTEWNVRLLCCETATLQADCSSYSNISHIEVTSTPTMSTFNIGHPPELPISLTDIFAVKSSGNFYDCDEYLKKSLILSDDVLPGFLKTLQTHLEDVQVFLGRIESWILEGTSNLEYLNTLFETDIGNEIEQQHIFFSKFKSYSDEGNFEFNLRTDEGRQRLEAMVAFFKIGKYVREPAHNVNHDPSSDSSSGSSERRVPEPCHDSSSDSCSDSSSGWRRP